MTPDLPGVTLPARREDGSSVCLAALVRVVGPWVAGPMGWLVGDVELSTGSSGSAELARLANTPQRLTTPALVALVADGVQLVDGEISCVAAGEDAPFLVLTSVRGDEWDVRARDAALLDAVRAAFPGAADLPPDVAVDPAQSNDPAALLCRVCGYRDVEPPWGADGRTPSFAFCPCCGVEWGYQDSTPAGVERFRRAWLAAGTPWRDPAVREDGLTTTERLRRLGPPAEGRAPG